MEYTIVVYKDGSRLMQSQFATREEATRVLCALRIEYPFLSGYRIDCGVSVTKVFWRLDYETNTWAEDKIFTELYNDTIR